MISIYISGPMTSLVDTEVAAAFDYAEQKLLTEGHTCFSPVQTDRRHGIQFTTGKPIGPSSLPDGITLNLLLLEDLTFICREAEAIALLKGWEQSKGCASEYHTALALGLTIIILGKEYIVTKPNESLRNVWSPGTVSVPIVDGV